MPEFSLVTVWRFQAPLEWVWDAIYHSEHWPHWWQNVERVEDIQSGAADGIGSVRRYTWRTCLPYKLVFDLQASRIEPYVALEAIASGDLEGYGRCYFERETGLVKVSYRWDVTPCIPWMMRLLPWAKPLFEWNHQAVMARGYRGLRRLLTVQASPALPRR